MVHSSFFDVSVMDVCQFEFSSGRRFLVPEIVVNVVVEHIESCGCVVRGWALRFLNESGDPTILDLDHAETVWVSDLQEIEACSSCEVTCGYAVCDDVIAVCHHDVVPVGEFLGDEDCMTSPFWDILYDIGEIEVSELLSEHRFVLG